MHFVTAPPTAEEMVDPDTPIGDVIGRALLSEGAEWVETLLGVEDPEALREDKRRKRAAVIDGLDALIDGFPDLLPTLLDAIAAAPGDAVDWGESVVEREQAFAALTRSFEAGRVSPSRYLAAVAENSGERANDLIAALETASDIGGLGGKAILRRLGEHLDDAVADRLYPRMAGGRKGSLPGYDGAKASQKLDNTPATPRLEDVVKSRPNPNGTVATARKKHSIFP